MQYRLISDTLDLKYKKYITVCTGQKKGGLVQIIELHVTIWDICCVGFQTKV